MKRSIPQQRTIIWLTGISLLIFVLFIPVNLKGAQDVEMLRAFEIDEYALYPHVIHMLTPGESLYQTLRHFFVYQHYFYGFPFYFFSALVLLPLRLILGAGWEAYTPVIVMILRQMINVLPMLAAIWILVWLQTRFKSTLKSIALFLFLAAIPGVVENNLWWHIDSLALLVVALVFLFLDRDQLRFGRYFYIAALICGVGVGIKYMGLFFCLAIPAYLLYGWICKKITLSKAALAAILFLMVMGVGLFVSNPLLLLPMERAEIIQTQQKQFIQTGTGYFIAYQNTFFENGKLPADVRIHYGAGILFIAALIVLIWGILTGKNRLHNTLILTFIVPMAYILATAATGRTHYYLPVALPLYSAFGLIQVVRAWKDKEGWAKYWEPVAAGLILLVILVHSVLFIREDVRSYLSALTKETTNPSITFSRSVLEVLKTSEEDSTRLVYKDWKIYFPQQAGYQVVMDWDLATYQLMDELNPDIILVENDNVYEFSKEGILEQAIDPEHLAAMHAFYLDAKTNHVEGYELIFQDNYGRAFARKP